MYANITRLPTNDGDGTDSSLLSLLQVDGVVTRDEMVRTIGGGGSDSSVC